MSTPFISLENVSKSFGGIRSLTDVDVNFRPGEAIALAGENGSGKSTLIKILSGVHAASSGYVVIDGRRHQSLRPIDSVRAGIQVIFQDFSLFPNLSVAENVTFSQSLSLRRRWVRREEMRALAGAVLQSVGASLDLDVKAEELSVANKQLVAIARALVNDARLIIMDEPTTALTENEVQKLLAIIRRLKDRGVSVVFVSHKLDELFSVCDRIIVLRNGEKVAEGPVAEFSPLSLTRHMTGRDLPESHYALSQAQLGHLSLQVKSIARSGQFSDVSFSVRAGEVLGIAGRLGSGRTELAKSLFGLNPIDGGAIEIRGSVVAVKSPKIAISHGVGYVPEDRLTEGLFFGHSIATNVAAGLLDRFSAGFGRLRKARLAEFVRSWLIRLNVKVDPEREIRTLSGGNQQRVVLARWLAKEPNILVLNGPTVGVDVGSKADIHRIISEFAATGIATLLISDDLSELVSCCNRVAVMRDGTLIQELSGRHLSLENLTKSLTA